MNLTPFDQNTIGESTQLLKALITHLDFNTQSLLATFIRLTELKLTMEYYSRKNYHISQNSNIDFKNIVNDIKSYCPDSQKSMFDNISQIINAYTMYSDFSNIGNMFSGTSQGFTTDTILHMLNPEQMELYKSIMEDF